MKKTYPDGSKYVGEGKWWTGKRHGQGTLTCPDGLKYDGWKGKLRAAVLEAQGTRTYSDYSEGWKYVWENGGRPSISN